MLTRLDPLPLAARCLEMQALLDLVRVDEAARVAWDVVQPGRSHVFSWDALNDVVNTLVTAGRYEEALQVDRAIPTRERVPAMQRKDPDFGLLQINVAEAEVNLGRPNTALLRLSRWDGAFEESPIGRAGLGLTRAWIHGMSGQGERALAAIRHLRRADLPRAFHAEFHFARAFAFLAAVRIPEASHEVEQSFLVAERPSSRRNAHFMKARVLVARERLEEAEAWCREAAEHPFRWQGADGLLLWGDVLKRLGRTLEARKAWELATERDAQSGWAREAWSRMAGIA